MTEQKGFYMPALEMVDASIRLPARLRERIHSHLRAVGVSPKRRARWIKERVEVFVCRSDAELIAEHEFMDPGKSEKVPFRVSKDFLEMIDEKVAGYDSPSVDRSNVIRAAIIAEIGTLKLIPIV